MIESRGEVKYQARKHEFIILAVSNSASIERGNQYTELSFVDNTVTVRGVAYRASFRRWEVRIEAISGWEINMSRSTGVQ